MRRRHALRLLAALLAACVGPLASMAQTAPKTAVIGRLHPGSAADPAQIAFLQALRDGLRALGHVEGQSYRIERRYAEGDAARLPAMAADLASMRVDLIVASGTSGVRAAKEATATIPIVMAMSGPDPVGLGLVASLARPGGNVTGFTGLVEELQPKQLELLREIVPGLAVVAVLYNRQGTTPGTTIARAATALGLQLHPVGVALPADLDDAVAGAAAAGASGMIVLADPVIMDRSRSRIAELALRHRLPSVGSFRIYAQAGGLVSYAEDLVDMHRRSAVFVDKILKGAKPADLPVEQPTKFELVINLRTARALGIEIPPALLARADEVIE